MTDKQKEAIRILNRIKEPVVRMGDEIAPAAISDEEYFKLLECPNTLVRGLARVRNLTSRRR